MKNAKQPNGLFVILLALIVGALLCCFVAGEDFYTYSLKAIEGASLVAPLNQEGMLARVHPAPISYDTEVKYRKFFITAPGAKQVELRADFNRWGKDPILLTPYKKGYFEVSVALTGGEYKYVFAIDGKEVPDPSNQDRQTLPDGREICIKTVR